jgi:cytidylate kinase
LARRAICISHLPGAGGEAVGRAVADRLDFRYVDEEVIAEAAESADLDPALIEDAERRKPLVSRLLGSLAERSSPTRLPDSALAERSLPSSGELQGLISDALRVLADEGSVVIVAHAGSVALAGGDVLRVLVTASTETRVERVAAAKRIDDRAATRRVREEDAARADYLKRFYGIQDEVPTLFDLVLNTDVLGPEKAAEVVLVAAA